jgi:threonine dehydratase
MRDSGTRTGQGTMNDEWVTEMQGTTVVTSNCSQGGGATGAGTTVKKMKNGHKTSLEPR